MIQSEPLLADALADDLANNRSSQGERPTADNTLLRGSDAYGCDRKIAFGALKIPRVVPFPTSTLMAFDAGQHHHTRLQGLLASKFGAELEVPVSYREQGIDLSGHADAVYLWSGKKRCVEIKSMKSYPFLKSAGGTDNFGRQVEPEGPKIDHILQAGIYGYSPQIQADELYLAYLNKEDGRIAEWLIPMVGEAVGPDGEDVVTLVKAELERLQAIAVDIKNGMLPWRRVPGYGVVKDPPGPDSKDNPWNCRYCAWQPLCASLPASKVPLTRINEPAAVGTKEEEPF